MNGDKTEQAIKAVAKTLTDKYGLDPLLELTQDAQYILLGEATHGTHEFYTWRAEISKRLIEEQGCNFIAVEGDWPDCYRVNRYVKGMDDSVDNAEEVLKSFNRWPTWMWANEEMVDFIEWLRAHNSARDPEERVGFYGLDVYSLWDSLHTIYSYLREKDPPTAQSAKKAFECFEPYGPDFVSYGWASTEGYGRCEHEILQMLRTLHDKQLNYNNDGEEGDLNMEQNAHVAKNAEEYYRVMIKSDESSWNLRDGHMYETLQRIMRFYGKKAKAAVWAHNTHIGDARATSMALSNTLNIGQIIRENHENNSVAVGFSTYQGSVIAAEGWDEMMKRMNVPEAYIDSWEAKIHAALGGDDGVILLRSSENERLDTSLGNRAIGVVYHPAFERGNYVPTILARRYDVLIHIDQTKALSPLHIPVLHDAEPPETYPEGY